MNVLTLTIDAEVTDNRRLIVARGRLIASNEYRAWKQRAYSQILQQLPHGWKPLQLTEANQLPYHVKVFLNSRRLDAENFSKVVRDVLTESGVWSDDRWAMGSFHPASLDPHHPRIVVTIPLDEETKKQFWPYRPFVKLGHLKITKRGSDPS